jgi:galactose mutarotase-like enzyme
MTVTLSHGGLTARIALLGAELQSLRRDGEQLMWQPRAGHWQQTAPWLFPVVGRLRDGGFSHHGSWHEMPLHGFAAAQAFELLSQTPDAVTLQLRSSERTREAYPFDFRLLIAYRLDSQGLTMDTAVHNDGDETLPFSLGAHPGFALPGRLDDWRLQFERPESPSAWRLQPDPLPWGLRAATPEPFLWDAPGRLQLHARLFERDAVILDPVHSSWVALVHRTRGERLRLTFRGAPTLGLWARPGAPFICIEPWWGRDDDAAAPHALLAKPQYVKLPAGKVFEARLQLKFHRCAGFERLAESRR